MEKFLFKKIELWLVVLILVLGLLGTVFFGMAVQYYADGGNRFPGLKPIIGGVVEFPAKVVKVLLDGGSDNSALEADEQRFGDEKGFMFNYQPSSRPDLGYLLLNRYDGDLTMSVSELVDLNSQETIHQWKFDVDPAFSQSSYESVLGHWKIDHKTTRFKNDHAFLMPDGRVMAHSAYSPLVVSSICSKASLFKDGALYTHSMEMDSGGNYWVGKFLDPKTVSIGTNKFHDDAMAQLSPNGETLFEKSIVSILDENSLGYLIYGRGLSVDDPIHINDIQPVLQDGSFWKKGDVFVSIRHQSMVFLYRPSSNQIMWHKIGPWIHQHDVDILDDHRIAIFDNDARLNGYSEWIVGKANNEYIYDFKTDTLSTPYRDAFIALDIRTPIEGRGEILPSGEIFVEESTAGRLLQFSADSEVIWQYINRAASNGKVYRLNWSRLISREYGDRVRKIIEKEKCDGQ